MKKIPAFLFLISLLLIGCQPKDGGTSAENSTLTARETDGAHTSKNSLQWHGMYKGVLPCADCEGIETVLVLNAEHTYLLQTKYLGKGDGKVIERTGSIAWNTSGNTIMLAGVEDAPSMYLVAENHLTQLDQNGNKITGDLADKYLLVKQ
jgi:copper homeostasis protein (lipoprotein)